VECVSPAHEAGRVAVEVSETQAEEDLVLLEVQE
jgi:hypothetical protein